MGFPSDFLPVGDTTRFTNTTQGLNPSTGSSTVTADHIDLLEGLGSSGDINKGGWVSKWLAPVTGSNIGKNYQAEYVDPGQISINSGAPLVLSLRASGSGEGDGQPILGAQIETGDVFKPGMYLEIDMAVPNLAPGMWPALWLDGDKTAIATTQVFGVGLGTYVDPEWPSKGEFDLFEHGGMLDKGEEVVGSQWDDDAFFSTVHCDHIQGNGKYGYTWNLQDCTSGGCSITDPHGAYVQGNAIDGKNMSLVGKCVGDRYIIPGDGPQKLSGHLCCTGEGDSCNGVTGMENGSSGTCIGKGGKFIQANTDFTTDCISGDYVCSGCDTDSAVGGGIGIAQTEQKIYYVCSDSSGSIYPCEQVASNGSVCTSMGACLSPESEGIPDSIFDINKPPYFNGIDSSGGKCKWHSDGTGACTDAMKTIINSKTNWADCMAQGATLATSKTPGCMACWQDNTGEIVDLYDTSTPSYCYDPALGPNDTLSARACLADGPGSADNPKTVKDYGCITLGGASITSRNTYGIYWSSDGKTVCTYVNGTQRGCRNIQYGVLNCAGDADKGTGVFSPKHVIINIAAGGALGGGDQGVDALLSTYSSQLAAGNYRMEIYSAKIYNVLPDPLFLSQVLVPAVSRNACVNLGESTNGRKKACCPGQGTPSTDAGLGDKCVPGGEAWAQGAANMGQTAQNSPDYTQMNTGTGYTVDNGLIATGTADMLKELRQPSITDGNDPRAGIFALPCEGGPTGDYYQCLTDGTWSCKTLTSCENGGGKAYMNVTKNYPNYLSSGDRTTFNAETGNVFAVNGNCSSAGMWGRSCDSTAGMGCEGYGENVGCLNWTCDIESNTCKPLGYIDPDAKFEDSQAMVGSSASGGAPSCNRGPFDTAPGLTNWSVAQMDMDKGLVGSPGWSDAYQNMDINFSHCSVDGASQAEASGLGSSGAGRWDGAEALQKAHSCCPGTRCVQGTDGSSNAASDFCCPDGYTDGQCQSIWSDQLKKEITGTWNFKNSFNQEQAGGTNTDVGGPDVPPWSNWGVTPGGQDPYQYGNCVDCVNDTVPCLKDWNGDGSETFLCSTPNVQNATQCGYSASSPSFGKSYYPGCSIAKT